MRAETQAEEFRDKITKYIINIAPRKRSISAARFADKEFEREFGEDIKDGLIYLFYDFVSGYKFRTRYYSVLNKLYTVNCYTDKFVLESITKNNLIVDFAEVSFDGVNFGEKKHIEQISDELIRTKHKGETYLKYRFNVSEKPIKLNLLAQNNNVSEITVNGKKVNVSYTDFDVKFYAADISEETKTGENEVVFKINYYQSPVVYDTLYGEGITESMVNMLVYNTIIEPVYIQSDCSLDENLRIGKSKLPLESAAFSNLTENGYKFFAGKAEIVGKVNLKGENHKLRLIGDYISADVYVNGKKTSGCVLDNECVLSGATEGENEIRIVLKSSLRNMFGPLHLKGIQEDLGIGPDAFTFPGKWRRGIPDNFTADYTVVPFGIRKIEIES